MIALMQLDGAAIAQALAVGTARMVPLASADIAAIRELELAPGEAFVCSLEWDGRLCALITHKVGPTTVAPGGTELYEASFRTAPLDFPKA